MNGSDFLGLGVVVMAVAVALCIEPLRKLIALVLVGGGCVGLLWLMLKVAEWMLATGLY